jgi:hypothetical protein
VIASIPLVISTNDTARLVIDGSGNFDFKSGTVTTSNASASEVGYKGIPRGAGDAFVTGSYTLVLTDAGKQVIYSGAGGHTFTIPANASVAYPLGTVLTVTNIGSGNLSIAVTTDTMYLTGTALATSGTRTLAKGAVATILKVDTLEWLISGAGVT